MLIGVMPQSSQDRCHQVDDAGIRVIRLDHTVKYLKFIDVWQPANVFHILTNKVGVAMDLPVDVISWGDRAAVYDRARRALR